MGTTANKAILRIELWHAGLLVLLLGTLAPSRLIEPTALFLGGVFMGVNFILLCYSVSWLLTPLASRGRIRAGVTLLLLKIGLFLGLISLLFFNFPVDAISFSVGFSTLLIAIVIEALRSGHNWSS
jgi:hypothetical protein